MTVLVLAVLSVSACSAGNPGTAGSSRSAPVPVATGATPAAAGGPFCDVARTSLTAMRPLSEGLISNPANVRADWEGIVAQWQAMAAAAPAELRGDFAVILDAWNHASDAAAAGGWDILSLTRGLAKQMDNDAFQRAYVHETGYVKDRCGIEPSALVPSA